MAKPKTPAGSGARLSQTPETGSNSAQDQNTLSAGKARGQENLNPGNYKKYLRAGLGVAGGVASAYALGAAGTEYINGLIRTVNKDKSTSYQKCQEEKIDSNKSSDAKDADWGAQCKTCAKKHTAIAKHFYSDDKSEGSADKAAPEGNWESFLSFMSEMSQPADLAGCINPYWTNFFSLIPYQMLMSHYLNKILRDALDGRIVSEEDVQEIIKDTQCGTELQKIITRSDDIAEFDYPDFDMFKLPPLPRIFIPNLLQILNKIIVDSMCWAICCTVVPILKNLTDSMLDLTDRLIEEEGLSNEEFQSSLKSSQIKKINLNDWISDETILAAIESEVLAKSEFAWEKEAAKTEKVIKGYNKALTGAMPPKPEGVFAFDYQQGVWRKPSEEEEEKAKSLILTTTRQFFEDAFAYSTSYKKKTYVPKTDPPKYELQDAPRDLGTKELIYLMLGETNCHIIQDIKSVLKSKKEFGDYLNLGTQDQIIDFFQFLFNYVNLYEVIKKLKPKDCPVDPCVQIDNEVKEEITAVVNNLCAALNPAAGMPPVPLEAIMDKLGITDIMNAGIKSQFSMLKAKYKDLLGNPSYDDADGPYFGAKVTDIPPKDDQITSYEMYTSIMTELIPNLVENYGGLGLSKGQLTGIYKNFVGSVLFVHPGWKNLGAVAPPDWYYDNVDFNTKMQGSTLADTCTDETFVETFNHLFKEGFEISTDSLDKAGKYAAEVQSSLFSIQNKLIEERSKRGKKKIVVDVVVPPTTSGNPCCKHLKIVDGGPYPLYEESKDMMINAVNTLLFGVGEHTDFPAAVSANDKDFVGGDVYVLNALYDSTEGFGNELDVSDINSAFSLVVGGKPTTWSITPEMRCLLCRRTTQFKTTDGELSLLDFLEDNLESEFIGSEAAKLLRTKLNCEEFGLATYRGDYNVLSCSTDGHGNCKGYKTKDYYKAVKKGECDSWV